MRNTLKLPYAGLRTNDVGNMDHQGFDGYYWSSVTDGSLSYHLVFSSTPNAIYTSYLYDNAGALSVRCFKN
jgi:hypothetical protein